MLTYTAHVFSRLYKLGGDEGNMVEVTRGRYTMRQKRTPSASKVTSAGGLISSRKTSYYALSHKIFALRLCDKV